MLMFIINIEELHSEKAPITGSDDSNSNLPMAVWISTVHGPQGLPFQSSLKQQDNNGPGSTKPEKPEAMDTAGSGEPESLLKEEERSHYRHTKQEETKMFKYIKFQAPQKSESGGKLVTHLFSGWEPLS